ncbi:MAG: YafY family protein [Pseudorhodobacter sp.]|jgi:predicted DNA-binding transcriptional regulator YafY|nr:YafY family protein [Pseudorhodobacter sp.]
MRRDDRLYELIQILRDGRLHTAQGMATRLGVSVRTIWRDMATLEASGVPVEGERGVGYILRAPITLPPMILSGEEMEALRLGMRLVAEGRDATLSRAARSLASKLAAVMPQSQDNETDEDALFVFSGDTIERAARHLPLLRAAVKGHERLTITYLDEVGRQTHRDIRPLKLAFWGRVWTLGAFCEARLDFRNFRLDRLVSIRPTGEVFPDEPGRSLADFEAQTTPDL